jgi:hypothetical protein
MQLTVIQSRVVRSCDFRVGGRLSLSKEKQEMKMKTQEVGLLSDEELSTVTGGTMITKCYDGKDMMTVNVPIGGGNVLIVSATSDWHHAGVYPG